MQYKPVILVILNSILLIDMYCLTGIYVIRRLGAKSIIICGVQTPNCIRGTAVEAIGLDYEVSVLSDATASKSEQVQESNLEGA